jgi:hypothetical protein
MLQKHHQNFKGVFLELDLQPVLTQFPAAQVNFEDPEVNQAWRQAGSDIAGPPLWQESTTVGTTIKSSSQFRTALGGAGADYSP